MTCSCERLDPGLEDVLVLLRVDQVGDVAVRVLEGTRDSLAGHLERRQHGQSEPLCAVQGAVVGLSQVDGEQHERDDDESGGDEHVAP